MICRLKGNDALRANFDAWAETTLSADFPT